jgi:hypothetical protein
MKWLREDALSLRENIKLIAPLRFLQNSDQEELFRIFEASPMKLPGLNLIYDRSPDLTTLLKCQAPQHETIIGEIDNLILGLASLSWGPRYVFGEKQSISYLGDLRTVRDHRAGLIWKGFFPLFLDGVKASGIQHVLTGILADNAFAIKSLTKRKENEFQYHYLQQLSMVNVLGQKPFHSRSKVHKVQKTPSVSTHAQRLVSFIDQREKGKLFGQCLLDGEWQRRLDVWPDFKLSHIYSIENTKGIRAICIPWSVNKAKRMKAQNIRWWFSLSLNWLKIFGIKIPKVNEALEVAYLTHLHFAKDTSIEERAELLDALIQEVKKEPWIRKASFISFADGQGIHKENKFKKYATQSTPVNLYLVTKKDETIPSNLLNQDISFEMALV